MNALPDIDANSVDTTADATALAGRKPFWMLAVAAVALGLIWPGSRSPLGDMAVELMMIVLVYLAVVRTAAFKSWWHDVPRSARRRAKIVVVALVVAHFFSISVNAFPVTQWGMYTRPTPEVAVAYELVGYTASGDEVTFAPSMTNRTLSTKLAAEAVRRISEQRLSASLDPADSAVFEQTSYELEQAIEPLALLHNQRSPDSAVVEVVILRTSFTSEQRRSGDGMTETVWRQEVGLP